MAQFAAVATLTFAVLGFQLVAFALLGGTLGLLLYGFHDANKQAPPTDE
jgi:cytochrome bd-type quinol oxidase subunit 1